MTTKTADAMTKKVILRVRCTLEEEMLGMTAGDPELATSFLVKKFGGEDKIPAHIKELSEEEKAAYLADEIEKARTLFPKDDQGRAFLWNYQIRGAFKDWCKGLIETGWSGNGAEKKGWNVWNTGGRVDKTIFVFPRRIIITLPEGGEFGECERPLRAQTQRGERIALAKSETVPAGSTFEFDIHILKPAYETPVKQWIEYGSLYRGLCAWRNSGKGQFAYTIETVEAV